jgi:hypothetical protein
MSDPKFMKNEFRLEVEVTAEDIRHGRAVDSPLCPAGRAILRAAEAAFPMVPLYIYVAAGFARLSTSPIGSSYEKTRFFEAEFPHEVFVWVYRSEDPKRVPEPTKFKLDFHALGERWKSRFY